MLNTFKNLSFRVKLLVTTTGVGFISILLVSLAFIAYNFISCRNSIIVGVQSNADIIADNTLGSTSFAVTLGTSDGWPGDAEATTKIREQEHFLGKRTPIVALTGHSMGA